MKFDRDYMMQILQVMEDHCGHQIKNFEIMSKVDAGMTIYQSDYASNIVNDPIKLEKFIGHVRHLYDSGFLACNNADLGFSRHLRGYSLYAIDYRLTESGHEYLSSLKGNSPLPKFLKWLVGFIQKIWGHFENRIASVIASLIILFLAAHFGWDWLSK